MASSMRAPTSWRIICAALGVGPEVVVGLCVERSPEMLVGLLGILKAGGAYLPLDPDYPPERLAFMLADAGAPVLVTHAALLDRLPAHGARIVLPRCRLAGDRAAARHRARQPPRPAQPRLCHLHLGLHRNAKGRGGRSRAASANNPDVAAGFDVGRDFRSALAHLAVAFDASIERDCCCR